MSKWQQTVALERLVDRGQVVYKDKEGRHQLAIFRHNEQCFAVDNRCPHEGYPLSQGTVDDQCVLTCNWHNWKFTLAEGRNLYGGDGLRTYPVEVREGHVWVDLQDPPPHEIQATVLEGLRKAVADQDHGWIARELVRLHVAGLDPRVAVRQTLIECVERLEYGATHCLAATADWLTFYGELGAEGTIEDQLICLTEAIDHMAYDSLREPLRPFPGPVEGAFDPALLVREIEDEDADAAIARVRGALRQGVGYPLIAAALARAALAHYTGFGHGLIYVVKAGELIDALGHQAVAEPVLAAVTRYLAYASREDLIPEFREYASFLAKLPADFGQATAPPDASHLVGASLSKVLGWVCEQAASTSAAAIYESLLQALATNMLRFDTAHSFASQVKVASNISWLGFTHGLTFANALRRQAGEARELWGPGLLQMGCFLARNRRFLGEPEGSWAVDDVASFFVDARTQVLDHGFPEPIQACHRLKTTVAVREEIKYVGEDCRQAVLAALNRFLHSPAKQKHVRRNVHQAIALIAG